MRPDDAGDLTFELRSIAFSLEGGSRVAGGVHEVEGGPGADAVLLPGRPVGVVEDGVAHVVAGDGAFQRLVVFFVLELWRVDADHDEGVTETLFEGPELFENVEAVDAAERPEVQEDDLTPQGLQGEVVPRVDPTSTPDQLRRPDPPA
jgi:hypothetical protein